MQLSREELSEHIQQWVKDKKAENIEEIDVTGKTGYVDIILICTGGSDMHVRAIAENVLAQAKDTGVHLLGKEGLEVGEWVLLDFGDIILHVLREEARSRYSLEELWEKQANSFRRIETRYD